MKKLGPPPDGPDDYPSILRPAREMCPQCDHAMGFHSASQTEMSVQCHLHGCYCTLTYDEAMDQAAAIRGDVETMKYRQREKISRIQKDQEEIAKLEHPDSVRFRALQNELERQRRRYEALLEQAIRAEAMRIRPIVISTTGGANLDPMNLPPAGGMLIENEGLEMTPYQPPSPPKKPKAGKPEPLARRVVKLPGKRGN